MSTKQASRNFTCKRLKFLAQKAYNMRISSIEMTTRAGSGHPTSSLSAADIMAVIFFHEMHIDLNNSQNPCNDRFVLSKGHAAPILYAAYKELGILSEDDLMSFRTFDSVLEGHPTPRFSWVDVATGSLGMGLSMANGSELPGVHKLQFANILFILSVNQLYFLNQLNLTFGVLGLNHAQNNAHKSFPKNRLNGESWISNP